MRMSELSSTASDSNVPGGAEGAPTNVEGSVALRSRDLSKNAEVRAGQLRAIVERPTDNQKRKLAEALSGDSDDAETALGHLRGLIEKSERLATELKSARAAALKEKNPELFHEKLSIY